VIINEPGTVIDYVLTEDRKKQKADQTTFRLNVLTDKLHAPLVKQNLKSTKEDNPNGQDEMISWVNDVLMVGLQGWTNLVNGQGIEIVFDKDRQQDMIHLVPLLERSELANGVMLANKITEDDSKN